MGMIPFAEIDYDGIGLSRSGSRDDGEEQEQSGDEQDRFKMIPPLYWVNFI